MKKTVQRSVKLQPRQFGEVLQEFLTYYRVPDAFTFKVRNRTQRRAQSPRKVVEVPKLTRTTAPALPEEATVQDLIRAFTDFLASAGFEDKLGIAVRRIVGTAKVAGPREIDGHTKLSTLRERAAAISSSDDEIELTLGANLSVTDLMHHESSPSHLAVAKAYVGQLVALVGKKSMARLVKAA